MVDQTYGGGGAFDLSHMVPTQDGQAAGAASQDAGIQPGGYPQAADPYASPGIGGMGGPTAGLPGATISAPLIVDVTEADIDSEMALSATVPVVLMLLSSKSLASKQALEVMESLARADAGAFQLAKVDVDVSPQLAAAFQAQVVPATYAIVAGRPVPLFEGVPTATQATEMVNEILQVAPQMGVTGRLEVAEHDLETPIPDEHLIAREAEDAGDWNKAVKAWKKVLASNPSDKEAKVALARARFERRYEKELGTQSAGDRAAEIDSPSVLADSMFAQGDEEGAFNVLLQALTETYDPSEKEKLRKQLVGLFPISTDAAAVKSARTRLATHLMV